MLSSNTLMTCDALSNAEAVRVPIRYAFRTCARAVIGHAAALPSSGMNSRRFIRSPNRGGLCRTCGRKHSTRHCQLEVAALRDFNPVYVSSGSIAPNTARVLQERMSVAPRERQLATKVRRVVKGQQETNGSAAI